MLEIARRDGARFLVTSTSECYGDPLEHPQVETYWGNVNPVGERSCYDESKRYAEAMTMAYQRSFGVRSNIARIFNTYGPRMALDDGRVVPAFLDQALRGRPLTDVRRRIANPQLLLCRAIWWMGLCRLMLSDERYPVNLGNPQELTILEFGERIHRLTGTTSGARIQAASAGRSQAPAARYFKSQTRAGMGRRKWILKPACARPSHISRTWDRPRYFAAKFTHTLAAAPRPSCTGLPLIRSVSVSS